MLPVPNPANSAVVHEVGPVPVFFTFLERTYVLLTGRVNNDSCSVSFSPEPLALVHTTVRINESSDSVSFIVFDLTDILVFAPPGTLNLHSWIKQTQKMFTRTPVVKTFPVKHIVFVVTVVVFVVLEYLESKPVASAVVKIPIVYIAVDPDPLIAQSSGNVCRLIEALCQFYVVVIDSALE